MKSYLKFAVAIVCFFCMTLFSADAYGQSSSSAFQKTQRLKQLYEQVHGNFARGEARIAFQANSTNVQKWNQVVNHHETNNAQATDQALLNEFYDGLVERAGNAGGGNDPNGGLIKN